MNPLPRAIAGMLAVIMPAAAAAQQAPPPITRVQASLRALFPDKSYDVWASAEGDLNGDGIADFALLLTGSSPSGAREERLTVLAGRADGQYTLLSMSGEYCHASKFYNLDIGRGSLFVEGVNSVGPDEIGAVTLQFRYDAKLGDLQLIGRAERSESQNRPFRYTASVNYLNHTIIHTRREGRRQREAKRVHPALKPLPLRGFQCEGLTVQEPRLYIDRDLKISE